MYAGPTETRLFRIRTEGEQAAVTVLHDEFARVPGRVGKASRELDTAGGKLGVEFVHVLNEQAGVEEFVGVFVRIRVTAASRDALYDYDHAHFALKRFLEDELLRRDAALMDKWIEASISPDCRLDLAILALAQHYGLPSHGLDVTRSVDIALWFATSTYAQDKQRGLATYSAKRDGDWKKDRADWPVGRACQTVTHSTMQSLHECEELAAFGFEARRPRVQDALFLGAREN